MFYHKVDSVRFQVIKDEFYRQLRNFDQNQPYQIAMYYSGCLLEAVKYSKFNLEGGVDQRM